MRAKNYGAALPNICQQQRHLFFHACFSKAGRYRFGKTISVVVVSCLAAALWKLSSYCLMGS